MNKHVNKARPVNLDFATIKFPITACASLIHRISGVAMIAGVLVLMWMLDMSLSSASGFDQVASYMASPLAKLIVWLVLSALAYHFVAGLRHLLMDAGVGETLEGGKRGAKITIVLSLILILLAGVWLW